MEISCDIIRDLLPLYAEDLTSPDSNALIDEHLCTCDECTRQLGLLKRAQIVPVDVETKTLKKVGNAIRRRRILAVLTALMVVASIFASIMVFMTVPIALDKEDAVVSVTLEEDGCLQKTLYEYAYIHSYIQDTDDFANKGMVLWSTRERIHRWKNLPYKTINSGGYGYYENAEGKIRSYLPGDSRYQGEEIHWDHELNHWYLNINTGLAEYLLWDGGAEHPKDMHMVETTPILGWLLFGCIVAVAFLWEASRRMKVEWQKLLMQRLAIAAGSIAYADIIVCWNRYVCLDMSNELNMRLQYIAILALILALTGLLWHQLHLLNKRDKAAA